MRYLAYVAVHRKTGVDAAAFKVVQTEADGALQRWKRSKGQRTTD